MNIIDQDILSGFSPVTLEEMDGVRLMNRIDTKFLFRLGLLKLILPELRENYLLLEVKGDRLSSYRTLYFDTPSYRLYLDHHNGHLNRCKVRYRTYTGSDLTYFEIKCKTNKGRTIKERVKSAEMKHVIEGKQEKLLRSATRLDPGELRPDLMVRFDRMTFVNRDFTERVTIDTGLTFSNHIGALGSYPGIVIAEVKNQRCSHSDFIAMMHHHGVSEFSISKYCLGMASLYDGLKKNNFKNKLHRIRKMNAAEIPVNSPA